MLVPALFQNRLTWSLGCWRRMNEEKFVGRFESAIVEFAILNRAATQNEITPDQVWNNLPKSSYKIERQSVTDCFDTLVEDGHLRKSGDKYTISDDGREDVQKLQPLALEISHMVQKGGNVGGGSQQQRPGMQQTQATTGGAGSQQPGNVGGQQNPNKQNR